MTSNPRTAAGQWADAARFLEWLDPAASAFAFRTLPDKGTGTGHNFTGSFAEHAATLAAENAAGRGVFIVVNAGGHRGAEVDRVRAVFADLDGAPLEAVTAGPLAPHFIVETSPGRWHCYWLCEGLALDQFGPVQRAIAARFGSDASVCDLPRVMRLPGFMHGKREPFLSRVVTWNGSPRYTVAQVLAAFPPTAATSTISAAPGASVEGVTVEGEGMRHADLVALCARLARAGLSIDTARATVEGEAGRGRWSRDVAGEIEGALQSAFAKLESGEIARPMDPWALGFGQEALPVGALAASTAPPARFRLTPAADLLRTPEPLRWLVRDMLLPATSSMLVGDPAAGKSLLVIDWASCIALGRDWLGRPVAPGFVVYLAGEGHHGIARRLKAWSLAHQTDLESAPLVVSDRGASLNAPASLAEVVAAIDAAAETYGRPALVVVDTLHRNLAGDENSAADTAAYFQAVDALRVRYGSHVLTVHHSGHGDKDRARGSSSLRAAVDTELLLGVTGGIRTLQVSKQKDGPAADPMHFYLEEVVLPWMAADGKAETSVVLAPSLVGPSRTRTLSPSLRLARDTLDSCGAGPVDLETWRLAFYERHPGENAEAKKKAFQRARINLVDAGEIYVLDDLYFIGRGGTLRDTPGLVPQCPGTDRDTPLKGVPLSHHRTPTT